MGYEGKGEGLDNQAIDRQSSHRIEASKRENKGRKK